MSLFKHALVRPPGENFADGLTRSRLGPPSYAKALEQHRAYCDALTRCGLQVTALPQDSEYPDSTFVEDVAVIVRGDTIVTRPGAATRRGEVDLIRATLAERSKTIDEIVDPGTLDGGDVCEAGEHVYIGISHRTSPDGAGQLARWLAARGLTSSTVDIRSLDSILHLKSGIAYIGDNTVVAVEELAEHPGLRAHRIVRVPAGEEYAANCVRMNDRLLVAAGYPKIAAALVLLGYRLETLEVSEFKAMDGGLSCLSLRF
jgi:dimethylargininase